MKLTELGKTLRKARIDNNEKLSDMANKLGISSTMLSSIETGTKAAPEGFADLIVQQYREFDHCYEALNIFCIKTRKHIKINLSEIEEEFHKDVIVKFSLKANQIKQQDFLAIQNILMKY